ncbi:cellular tumor antigen p53 isoform X3 [Strongylocentrotus purpuratus]|nr:cellular tumor antigen p53 isoform X3 [Strongylocentrotus purpuratus]XP_011681027.1 cellular tumor antigen p53 isoform X3 [Strongylocentrotus purpuratus]XP_030842541.1 cellular tumor antigen p53 isoform X3 [Strongylocentrotus purpuratus]|eukprot:XP_011680986.1 PREDICTED: cellular tumor antigen p53 isoform X3 [Strongylocentrotus purpuratus]
MPSSTGYASATEPATSPPPSFSPPPNNQQLPSNVEYPGDYAFEINLGQPTSQAAKSVSWTYSPTLKKLFVDRDKPCPIQFKTTSAPPPNCFIRVLPIFKQAENLAEVVSRCPNHVGSPQDYSKDHLVLCSDPATMYYTDLQSARHSLVVPYTVPQVGTEFSKYLFTFKCFISCVGGLNRRKIQLVFTLENETGSILGRQVLDVRVCACPGRDRKTEEKSFEKSKAPQKKPLKRGPSKVTSVVGLTSFSKKAKKDEETFLIEVQGREKYELLMKIKESLDLMDCVAPNQISQYRQQQAQQQMRLNNHLPNGVPNLPRVSSFQSTPPPSTSQGNTFHPTLALNSTPPLNHAPSLNHSSPPLLNHSHSYQQQQTLQQPFTNLEPYPPSTSTSLERRNTMPCKDEADGPNMMEVDAIPTSQGFPVTRDLTLPNPCHTQNISPSQDPSIDCFLKRLGLRQHSDIFTQKNVHTVDQLEEINMEDLSSIPHQQREILWKAILELKGGLQLNHTPTMNRGNSSASTTSIHSSGGSMVGNQVYRATRFTLKQTLSFKVEKEDD